MSEGIRVLHVDDEPEFAEMTATFLERGNDRLSVETATDADDGVKRLGENEYDCVVSDYDMPGDDGIEFLESVRKEYPDLPFILFTGKGSEEVASEAISAGVTDYLQKRSGTEQYELLVNRIGNVVERHHTEAELRESEEKYRTLVENSHDGVYIATDPTSLDFVNDRACEITGYSKQELLGMNPLELVHPGDRDEVREMGKRRWGGGDPPDTYDARVVTEDGETRHCEFAVELIDYQGEKAVMGSLNDVTERKRREKRLRELKERLNLAVEAAGLGVWDWDIESGEVAHNEQWAEMFGLPPEEGTVSVESIRERSHPERVSELEEVLEEVITGQRDGYDVEVRRKTADGDWKWVRTVGQVAERDGNGRATRLVGVNIDIDELKRQKEELERYKTFIESSPDVITHLGVDGEILYQSPAIEKIGYSQDESVGDTAFEYVHPDDRQKAQQEFFEVLENPQKDSGMVEYRVLNGEGEYIWAEAIGKDQRDTETGGIVINQRDISKRKERERAVERAHEQLRQVIDLIPDPVFAKSLDDEILLSNEANADLLGSTPEEVEGKTEPEIMPDVENYEQYRQRDIEVIERGESTTFEEELMDPDGETHVFKTTRIPFETASTEENAVLGYARDITSLKEYEQELERSNEELDQFASVVSHDLRNPLAVAEGRLELAKEDCDSEHLDDVDNALERMEALIEDILTLAREGDDVGEMEAIDIEELFENCWSNVETETATLVTELEKKIQADPSRLKQVCENLLRNSVEHGGEGVTVTVGNLTDGFYVADDGDGIPEKEHEEVFEAGYSTSEDGTGFGLRIVKQIVEAHGWEIQAVESDDGGARFEVTGVETVE